MTKIISEWIRCPVCGNKTRLQIRANTELKNFPLYCLKCKQESLIDAKKVLDAYYGAVKQADLAKAKNAAKKKSSEIEF